MRKLSQWTTRHPAVAAVLPLIAGILCFRIAPPLPWLWLSAALVLAIIGRWFAIALVGAICLIGLTGAQLQEYFYSPSDIGAFASPTAKVATLEFRLDQVPRTSRQWIDTQAITLQGQPVLGRLSVSGESPFASLEPGQVLRAAGWLARPPPLENPGGFDAAGFDRSHRILADFRVKANGPVDTIARQSPGLLERFQTQTRGLMNDGFVSPASTDATFLRGLVLGDADPSLEPVKREFDITGTEYLFSTSGLHVAIFGALIAGIMRLLRQPPRAVIWVTIACMALVVAAVVPSESGVRALLMSAAAMIGLLLGRRSAGLQLLAVAVFILLAIRPLDLFTAGFQIGAVAVLALILLSGRLPALAVVFRVTPEPDGAASPRPSQAAIAFRDIRRKIWNTIAGSAIAWLAVIPVLAVHFQQFSPWTVPGGLALFPLTIIAVLGGITKIFLTAIFPPLNTFWAAMAAMPIHAIQFFLAKLSQLPGASLPISPPPAWAIFVYYALLALPLVPWQKAMARFVSSLAPLGGCVGLILIALPRPAATNELHITFLSAGNAQAALVAAPPGAPDLLDCDALASSALTDVIEPCIRAQPVKRVDCLFVQHGKLTDRRLRQIDDALGNPAASFEMGPATATVIRTGDPDRVVKLSFAGMSILFAADISPATEASLTRTPIKSDVLIAPRHGSAEPTTAAFLKAVNPQIIICCSSPELSEKQRQFDKLASKWTVYRTGESGAIELTITPDGKISIRPLRGGP